jgi:hypothetical protein
MLAAQAIPEIYKIAAGQKYKKQSEEYAKTQRPKYEIPKAMKDYLRLAQGEVKYKMPGYDQATARIYAQNAQAMEGVRRGGRSSAEQMAGIVGINRSAQEALVDLDIASGKNRQAAVQNLYGAQQAMAGEEKAQWDYDKNQPYLNAMKTAAELQQAGQEAQFYGLEGLSNIFTSGLQMGREGMFGEGGRGDTPGATAATTDMSGRTMGATGGPNPTYFDPNAVYGTGGAKPIEQYNPYGGDFLGEAQGYYEGISDIEYPSAITNAFNSQYYGMPVTNEMSDYYGLGDMYSRTLNNVFRRRGSTRTRTYRR